MTPVLRVDGVDFAYGRLQVLFGVSLHVEPGEALALLGTNGAGKSTLLRVVSGLEHAGAGTIELEGQDVTNEEAESLVRRRLVLVPGGRAVFPDMTVAENLEMQCFTIRRRRAEMIERRDSVLETFPRLGERLHQRAGTMSGGEQQQLGLAKALLL
ncbi:MAG: ATP-binding cassette domain-containing protein, partial [Actinobacteria bacterium]|nr:ATP-binding cassette domain-containing protein [Actinomycetota bacterium]